MFLNVGFPGQPFPKDGAAELLWKHTSQRGSEGPWVLKHPMALQAIPMISMIPFGKVSQRLGNETLVRT